MKIKIKDQLKEIQYNVLQFLVQIKNGVKEPVQFIKATTGDKKPGVEPISY